MGVEFVEHGAKLLCVIASRLVSLSVGEHLTEAERFGKGFEQQLVRLAGGG